MATTVTFVVADEIKEWAESIYSDCGLTLEDALITFMEQTVRDNALPFEITEWIPNAETLAAIEESEKILSGEIPSKSYTDIRELLAELESEED